MSTDRDPASASDTVSDSERAALLQAINKSPSYQLAYEAPDFLTSDVFRVGEVLQLSTPCLAAQ